MDYISTCDIPCPILLDLGANVTLPRTDLDKRVREQLIYTARSIYLKTATNE